MNRSVFRILLLLLGMSLFFPGESYTDDAENVARLIREAGNAAEDGQRLESLRELRALPGLGNALALDADRLIEAVDRWINDPRLDYFGSRVRKEDDFDFKIPEASPLYPLTWLYRGRMLTWAILEYGGYGNRELLDKARGFFESARETFPGEPVARIYLGEIQPPEKVYPVPEGAPEWAVHQREALERLTDIIHWWIDHRMQEDGQYGGGWGDDCEMWRWWTPVLLGFEDPKIIAAQARFSEALMAQPHMALGYTDKVYDVEHTAEDSSDVMTAMMHLEPDNPVWRDRAMKLADFFEHLWTGRNERGQLQFKSTYFSSKTVDLREDRACDTVYHPRAVQPALLLWQRTDNPRLGRLFTDWMDTWADATARAERGKAAGIVPSAIHWPGGDTGGTGPDWWDPQNHSEPGLYRWPSAMSMMLNTMLLAHHQTGEARYLEPIRSMAAARMRYLAAPTGNPEPGSEAWCAQRMHGLSSVLGKYRWLTQSTEFDALLEQDPSPYAAFYWKGDEARLLAALRRTAVALSHNFRGYTSEVRYTDRVLRFPSLFSPGSLFPEGIPGIDSPDTGLLYSSVTGDPGDPLYFPLAAVRWRTPARDFAALVTESKRDGFSARLFHFGEEDRPLKAEFFLLDPGAYQWTLQDAASILETQSFRVEGPRAQIALTVPPQRECEIEVRRIE